MVKHYPIVVIGAGAGGLVVAIGAAKSGKKVLLVEKAHYGGDCTNFGCIPSKTLIASGEKAHALKSEKIFGLEFDCKPAKTKEVLERVRRIVKEVRAHEDPSKLEEMGVHTLTGLASFTSPHELIIAKPNGESHKISAGKIVIAAGSHPFIPPINGLKETPYLTNETIFDLKEVPNSLAILGAGPIGCELAQAFARLGTEVTIIESDRGVMPNEPIEAQALMADLFQKEGISINVQCRANSITYQDNLFSICIGKEEPHKTLQAEMLLVATGRRPNISALLLDKAEVKHSEKGIPVNVYGQTNQPHIFAIGDILGGPFFTHLAEHQGRAVLTSLILPGPFKKKFDQAQALPHCTFTDPEVAGIGLSEEEAIKKFGEKKIASYFVDFSEVDRNITASRTEGFLRVVTKKWSSKILGATIVGPRAGEMLSELSLAMLYNIPLRKLARLIHPYPTYNAAIRKSADMWLSQTILPLIKGKKP